MASGYLRFIKRRLNVSIPTIWIDTFGKKDPELFVPSGSQIYHGRQGQGKSYTMFLGLRRVEQDYPKSVSIVNMTRFDRDPVYFNTLQELREAILFCRDNPGHYIRYYDYKQALMALRYANNDKYGVTIVIDEMHQYFHSHDSKGIPAWMTQVFSQQRKRKMLILGSAQKWPDVAKVIRDQIVNLLLCHRVGHLIKLYVVDPETFETNYGQTEAPIKMTGWEWLRKEERELYDTSEVINSGRDVFGGNEMEIKKENDIDKVVKVVKKYRRY